MTDIALLITGVLKTGQLSPLSLALQRLVQLDDAVEKPKPNQQSQIVSTAYITPPEFMPLDGATHASLSARSTDKVNILNQTNSFVEWNVASENEATVNFNRQRRSTGKQPGYQMVSATSPSYIRPSLPTLRFGNSGLAVRALQRLLLSQGYTIRVDGVFSPLTETAVKAFQYQRRLEVDGVVGQNTWYELTK